MEEEEGIERKKDFVFSDMKEKLTVALPVYVWKQVASVRDCGGSQSGFCWQTLRVVKER